MATCEDFPCCGHEAGCCPDFDQDGNQLNMVCVCGAKIPVDSKYSICSSCMDQDDDGSDYDREDDYFDDDGQPTEYEEWQDLHGGDDWDHGQFDCDW